MAKVRIDLRTETFDRLLDAAINERRPLQMQAEVLLERALGMRQGETHLSQLTVDDRTPPHESREVRDGIAV